jgi:hypothetical protein
VLLAYAVARGGIEPLRRRAAVRGGRSIAVAGVLLVLVCCLLPPWFYAQLSVWGRQPGIWHARYNNAYTRNSHDAAEYIANPNKRHWNDVEEFAELIFAQLPRSAHYVDDDSRTYYPIHYFKTHLGKRRDLNVHIINSWGFSGWGWSKERFATVLAHSYRTDRPLFLITIDHPFADFLATANQTGVFQFERFPLDDHRWIYRLKTATDLGEQPATPFRPAVHRLRTGLDWNTHQPRPRDRFTADQAIMAALDFELNPSTFMIRFRWLSPSGQVAAEDQSSLVPVGNTRVWTFLDPLAPRPSGRWRVQALSDDELLGECEFVIE